MAKKKQNSKGKRRKAPIKSLKSGAEPLILPPDYSLIQDGALYSEVVVKAHIRISNDQVSRTAYAVEMHVDPSLSDQIPESWGMVKFTEVLPEVGNDGGPGEIFVTRPVAVTDMSGSYLRFDIEEKSPVAEKTEPNPASFLNARIEHAIGEVVELHRASLAARESESLRKRKLKKATRTAGERKGP